MRLDWELAVGVLIVLLTLATVLWVVLDAMAWFATPGGGDLAWRHLMGLIELLLVLILLGVLLYLVETYLPMAPPIKLILRIVVVLVIVLWLVRVFIGDVAIPRLR